MEQNHEKFMQFAIEEAQRSAELGQYPLGAVVVLNGEVISVGHTTLHEENDPTVHAEINAIREATKKLVTRYLPGAWLYTTQEPCPMCTSAAIWAKMEGIVFAASLDDALQVFKKQKGSSFTWRQIEIPAEYVISKGEPKLQLVQGVLREKALELYTLTQ